MVTIIQKNRVQLNNVYVLNTNDTVPADLENGDFLVVINPQDNTVQFKVYDLENDTFGVF